MFIQLFLLILANILLSISPIFLTNIDSNSVFGLTFARFFNSFVIELVFFMVLLYLEMNEINKLREAKNKKENSQYTKLKYKNMMNFYFRGILTAKNKKLPLKMSNYTYYIILGIALISLSIPFYYLSFINFGVVLTTVVINATTVTGVFIYNMINKEEDFNLLYGTYLVLIITAVFTSAFGREAESVINYNYEGIISICITIFSWIGFIILTDKSSNTPTFKIPLHEQINVEKTSYHAINRSLFQLTSTHLFGTLFLFPTIFISLFLGPNSEMAQEASEFMAMTLSDHLNLLMNIDMIMIAIVCTTIPYLLIFVSAASWPKQALKHDQWNSILTTLEPLIGLYIGYFIWGEKLKVDYIVITTIILTSAIVIRYFYENGSLMEFYIFLKVNISNLNNVLKLRELYDKEIQQINIVSGNWDVILNVNCRSTEKFNQLLQDFRYNTFIEKLSYSIVKKKIYET